MIETLATFCLGLISISDQIEEVFLLLCLTDVHSKFNLQVHLYECYEWKTEEKKTNKVNC